MSSRSGAHLVTDALVRAGVKTVFSLSGNQIMPIYDACIDAGIRIVHVRHEAAAVHMADAWAQLTGQIGVALLTAAPGLTNGLSPLFSARSAESPVLLLSGDSPLAADGMGAFQELAQTDITAPLVKASLRPRRAAELQSDVCAAITVALSGRPGPVHVALPFDLLQQAVPEDQIIQGNAPARKTVKPAQADVTAIAQQLAQAARPLILAGPMHNESRAASRLKALREALGVPVVPMESPRGLRDPMLGAFASVLAQADLVLLVGKPLDFTLDFGRAPTWNAETPVLVVDPEQHLLDRARNLLGTRLTVSVRADADAMLDALTTAAAGGLGQRGREWGATVDAALAMRTLKPGSVKSGDGQAGAALPTEICAAVQKVLDTSADPILICDGGEFGQWAQAFCHAPTRLINGVSGAIGGGLCYAVAASLARPEATIVALMGDGTVGFHFTEFETAIRENARFMAVVGNDSRWNAEHVIQMREYGPERLIGCSLSPSVRYDLAVAGFGAHGAYVKAPADLGLALEQAGQARRAACINIELNGQAAPAYDVAVAAPGAH
ncbi:MULTISPECIES: thiamine pyrophosphate-binding protein [unclassified Achromobacter]|uniref:thiamine pyrophosphate-binding protein n=1 Tax=unclassified Achromobacter TaxID=2626865 RepID=UPI000B51D068|nr:MULTISPECIES: thiamine pyrophosphate-binding protein [unclassified Achromobacter]OWT76979.1 acetolactate synthase [Achromobacter sp. HZ28]OWT77859.1 acetolactate synthase [Achromobacter sp. HZ34]